MKIQSIQVVKTFKKTKKSKVVNTVFICSMQCGDGQKAPYCYAVKDGKVIRCVRLSYKHLRTFVADSQDGFEFKNAETIYRK